MLTLLFIRVRPLQDPHFSASEPARYLIAYKRFLKVNCVCLDRIHERSMFSHCHILPSPRNSQSTSTQVPSLSSFEARKMTHRRAYGHAQPPSHNYPSTQKPSALHLSPTSPYNHSLARHPDSHPSPTTPSLHQLNLPFPL